MTLAPNFFDAQTRNWRGRPAISVDVMRELSRYSDPQDMHRIFTHRLGQLFPTTRQLTLSRRGVEKPHARITRFNLWSDTTNPYTHWDRFPIVSGGLLSSLLYSDEPRLIDDLNLFPNDPAMEYLEGQRSLLSIPIFEHGVAQNTVVVTREESNAFPPEQVPELVWMTNLFGRATQTLVLSQALQKANETADAELRDIAELQQSLLPSKPPTMPGLDVAVYYRAACLAGGDYYDFFPLPDGSLGILVADVSGHGSHAAVLMAITHSIAHAAAANPAKPGPFLTHLNANLAGRYNRHSGVFVTAFYAVFDPNKNTITYASAGHVPPRLIRCSDGSRVTLNRVQRLPLGVSPPGLLYPEFVVDWKRGDQVVVFTDGVTEAVDSNGDVFGTERIDERLASCPATADALRSAILGELDQFTNRRPPTDDRTLVVVRRT